MLLCCASVEWHFCGNCNPQRMSQLLAVCVSVCRSVSVYILLKPVHVLRGHLFSNDSKSGMGFSFCQACTKGAPPNNDVNSAAAGATATDCRQLQCGVRLPIMIIIFDDL